MWEKSLTEDLKPHAGTFPYVKRKLIHAKQQHAFETEPYWLSVSTNSKHTAFMRSIKLPGQICRSRIDSHKCVFTENEVQVLVR